MNYLNHVISEFHSTGLLIDTNLLLLLIVGKYDVGRVGKFKRTHTYTEEDFELLNNFSQHFLLIVTPNILTEITNLSATLNKQSDYQLFSIINNFVNKATELYTDSKSVTSEDYFLEFGLTDSTIYKLSNEGYLVLTDDLPLYGFLYKNGNYVINFNHVRTDYILKK